MAGSRKKTIVRLKSGSACVGYLPASGFVVNGQVELLGLEGRIELIPAADIRLIAYVRDFNLGEPDPEQLTRRAFLARPRTEGLWVRLTLDDGELLEGLGPLDLSLLDSLLLDRGLFLIPPDVRSNTQRLFVPREAIAAFQVLGVVTTPTKTSVQTKAPKKLQTRQLEGQESLFPPTRIP